LHYEKELDKLNENQREAVYDESNACVVNANVGSGKTTVLISKIIYLHQVKHIDYRDMVVLTFTNKAANEIKERLFLFENNLNTEELQCFGTFHSVALHFLRNLLPIEQLGYSKDFWVIEPEEELDIALQIIHDEKLIIKYKNRLKKRLEQEQVSRYQDDLIKLKELLQEEKIKQNKMSFSDLLINVSHLLKDQYIAPEWIIIDEVQDSDKMQLDFIDALKKNNTKIFAVGDPNQVIYSWRGSSLNVFYTLKEKYKARELSLPVNYRSSTSILEAAKCFLDNKNTLAGIREPGDKIIVKRQYNSFQEACYLADRIKEIHEMGTPYGEIAIFYRLQNQSEVFEDVFTKDGIPYEVSLKKTIRDIPVLNWAIKLLRFSLDEKDIASGIIVLSNKEYGQGITEKAALKLVKERVVRKQLKEEEMQIELKFETKIDFLDRMLCFRKEFSEKLPDEYDLYEYFDFDSHLHPTAVSYQEDKESVKTLLNMALVSIKEKHMPFFEGLTDFINSSALNGLNIIQRDISRESDSVKLMTLHASKGLEFSYVFITGVNYGLIPLQSKSFEDEDEERRLFYVGITRAKDYLELSYYSNPDIYRTMPGESRFIRMIPGHLIQSEEIEQVEVNLQEMKRQIQAERTSVRLSKEVGIQYDVDSDIDCGEDKIISKEKIFSKQKVSVRKVSHVKYGIGTVVLEDDIMITVEFEGYGEKEFMKGFSELEEV
jgi:DNA helicase-2/ATP-dependent DNA helicase PcrA